MMAVFIPESSRPVSDESNGATSRGCEAGGGALTWFARSGAWNDRTSVIRQARWIAVAARMGLWGLVAALSPVASDVFGGPRWLTESPWITPYGFSVSGLGIVATGVLVLKALPPGPSALKLAALAGIPLGLLFASWPVMALAPFSWLADVVSASGSLAVLLGVLVVVALLFGFLGGRGE
jgi:hypothetical protein